jgi:hypothetical protein
VITFLDGATVLGSSPIVNGSASLTTTSLAAGTHPNITAVYSGDGTFLSSTSAPLSEIVNQFIGTNTAVSASPPSSVFGQTVTFTATVSGSGSATPTGTVDFVDTTTNTDLGTAPLSGGSASVTCALSVATHTITATYSGDSNFIGSSGSTSETVTTDPTTAVINAPTITYGADGTVAVTVSSAYGTPVGNVSLSVDGGGALTAALFNGTATFTLPSPSAGDHSLAATYAAQGTFAGSSAIGTLHVDRAPLVVTVDGDPGTPAADPFSRVYGQPNPAFAVRFDGFVNSDTPASLGGTLAFTTAATQASDVGDYPVAAGGLTSSNYAIAYVGGTLTVTPAPLTVPVIDFAKSYGQEAALTGTVLGIRNGDNITVTYSSPGAAAGADVGSYDITAALFGDKLFDYQATIHPGTLTVNLAPLMVIVNDATRVYGASNPAFTVHYFGFVLGQVPSDLSGALAFTTSANSASHVGNYTVQAGGLDSTNYAIGYAAGTLAITPATLTITADDQTMAEGGPLPLLTVHYSGFVNGENAAYLAQQPTVSTTATPISGPGTYPITVNGASDPDYSFRYVSGTLTVTTADSGVGAGQTATIGFWQNSNGQALIRSLNGGPGSTQLGSWLAATFSNLYGVHAGTNNLAGRTNAQVADLYTSLFARTSSADGPPKVDAQVLAVALAVYVTNQDLAGTTAAAYGFRVTAGGVGNATFNVGSNGAAFGVANYTTMTVLDLLLAADARSRNGVLYDLDGSGTISGYERSLRALANTVFAAVNQQGGI